MRAVSQLLLRRFARCARPFLDSCGLLQTSKVYKRSALVWEPGAERVLVLAPHMDDETIGCGGTIARHRAQGAEVCVVFLTDGRLGSSALTSLAGASRLQRTMELIQVRKNEAVKALGELGVHDHVFLDAEDGSLCAGAATVSMALRDILVQRRPDLVYLPFFLEQHPDHWAVSPILLDAVRDTGLTFQCMLYEVWTPLFPNCLVRIDETLDAKKKALAHYTSQLNDADYIHFSLGLAAYRACAFSEHRARYAEAFCSLPLPDFRAMFETHNVNKELVPCASA